MLMNVYRYRNDYKWLLLPRESMRNRSDDAYCHPEANSGVRCRAQKGPYWELLMINSTQYNIETICVNIATISSPEIFANKYKLVIFLSIFNWFRFCVN